MIGLLKKDGLVLIRAMRWMVLFIAVFLFLPGMQAFGVIYLSILTITTISYDEQAKWDVMARMMPYSPFEVVFEKYLFGYLSGLIGAVGGTIAVLITALFQKAPFSGEELLGIVLTFLVGQLFLGINLPLIFRFGAAKTRVVTLVLCGALGGIFAAFGDRVFAFLEGGLSVGLTLIVGIAALAVAALHAVGIPLSVRFYQKQAE